MVNRLDVSFGGYLKGREGFRRSVRELLRLSAGLAGCQGEEEGNQEFRIQEPGVNGKAHWREVTYFPGLRNARRVQI